MPAPSLMKDVALAEFGVRVCRYDSSGECNRLLGGAAVEEQQYSAAVSALIAKAKLSGLWIERSRNENENTVYVISDEPMTEDAWAAAHSRGWCRDGIIPCGNAVWNVPPDPGLARYHQCLIDLHDGLRRIATVSVTIG